MYVGRVAAEKSIDFLISSYNNFARDVHAKMVIVGDGPARANLEKQVKALNLEDYVIFVGMVPWINIGLYYQIGDCFINASVTETQGLTYIEALSSNLPVVVRHDKNLEDLIVDGENGLFYTSPEEFSQKVKNLINDKELAAKLKANAYNSVKRFSKEKYAQTINELYKSIVKK